MEHVLKIAAIDDIPSERKNLAKKIKGYMEKHLLKYEILYFENGESFVAALKKERFDIVFMDIFMDGMSGITAAGKLRELDMDCKLIFLTISRDFLEEGYSFNPCHYLVKPIQDTSFNQAMENCCIKRPVQVPFLKIVSGGSAIQIDTTEILYIDTDKRTVMIHTTGGNLSAGRGFATITEPLRSDERFLQCIKGILVNMDFISAADGDVFLLKNGERLHISLRNKNKLIKQYRAYQFERTSRMRNCL